LDTFYPFEKLLGKNICPLRELEIGQISPVSARSFILNGEPAVHFGGLSFVISTARLFMLTRKGKLCSYMDIQLKDYKFGKLRIESTVQQNDGCKMILTAKSSDNSILWKTFLTDEFGNTKIYCSVDDALQDVESRMKALA
jgi:hypothetical protein